MTKPAVLPAVFYQDRQRWQRFCLKLLGQCNHHISERQCGDTKACLPAPGWAGARIEWYGQQWLEAGFIDRRTFFPTEEGLPQGGIASQVLTNMTLDGLEAI